MAISQDPPRSTFRIQPILRVAPRDAKITDSPRDSAPSESGDEGGRELQFVNVGTFDESKSLKTRKIVRGHVMKRVRKAQRDLRAQRQLQAQAENCEASLDGGVSNTLLGQGQVDPFSAYPINMQPYMHELVDYYVKEFSASHIPFHVTKDNQNPLITTFYPTIFDSAALLQALLCITSAAVDARHGLFTPTRATLAHRGEAIRLLREGFGSPDQGISNGAIGAIVLLSGHEIIFGDAEAFDAHMQGLYRMVSLRGGLDSLGMNGILKTMILWADQYRSLYLQVRPYYTMNEHRKPRCPRSALHDSRIDLQESLRFIQEVNLGVDDTVGEGFRDAGRSGLLEPTLAINLEDMCQLARLREFSKDNKISKSQSTYMIGKRDFLENQLTSFSYANSIPGSREHCCSIAAMIYDNMIFRNFSQTSSVHVSLTTQLMDVLQIGDMDKEWAQNAEMLLWILFAASSLAPGGSVRDWFRKELRGYTSRLRSILGMEWPEVRRLLNKFLWSDIYCEEAGRAFWEEMLDAN